MNPIQTANPRRLAIFVVLLLIISALLLLWLREVVREIFVLPLSYLFYLVGIFVRTTPQMYFWIVLLLVTFMIAYRSLARRTRRVELPADYSHAELSYDPTRRGRVYSWLNKYGAMRASKSSYYGNTFHQSLGRLLLELLAHRYHLPPLKVEQRLRNQTLDVPEEIRDYVLRSLRPPEPPRTGLLRELWEMLAQAVRGFVEARLSRENSAGGPAQGLDPQLARIITYIEDELEVTYDDSGR